MSQQVSSKRHLAKTVTWRLVGTLDTMLISTILVGNPFTGIKIGFLETFSKMVLYYAHERVWVRVDLTKNDEFQKSKTRHITKAITWRFIGTLDTFLLSWFLTGNLIAGLKIGGVELITKPVLYYLHERIWYKSNYGIKRRCNE
ncbi:DUF2061 domain-containing protein [Mesonia maritima]|uniref:Membrane protein n=1 Tax=Mesonia maritima TaxID=1793873 RepID=A0ABU1K890_9FLAO|nr:DUF2061 domain-containing protein [Mesonia maritima]MDR6301833.1 putative membrane protein [Mesonia maritima]